MRLRLCPKILAAIPLLLALLGVGSALAAWTSAGSGAAAGAATTMPTGNAPTASVSGSDVTVTWSRAAFPNGAPVGGYIIHRYDAATGAPQVVGAGCDSAVTTTSCTEQNVPGGSWVYSDTPAQQSWTGGASADSNTVTVRAGVAPATTLAPQTRHARTQVTGSARQTSQAVCGHKSNDCRWRRGPRHRHIRSARGHRRRPAPTRSGHARRRRRQTSLTGTG
jgi:hypothetical protein